MSRAKVEVNVSYHDGADGVKTEKDRLLTGSTTERSSVRGKSRCTYVGEMHSNKNSLFLRPPERKIHANLSRPRELFRGHPRTRKPHIPMQDFILLGSVLATHDNKSCDAEHVLGGSDAAPASFCMQLFKARRSRRP